MSTAVDTSVVTSDTTTVVSWMIVSLETTVVGSTMVDSSVVNSDSVTLSVLVSSS